MLIYTMTSSCLHCHFTLRRLPVVTCCGPTLQQSIMDFLSSQDT